MTIHPNGKFAYATQQSTSKISMFSIGADGVLSPMSPFSVVAGGGPVSIALSPNGKFAYSANIGVTNHYGNTLSQYSVGESGILTQLSIANVNSDSGPNYIAIDNLGRYVYSANTTGGTISQFNLSSTGALTAMNTPSVPAAYYAYSMVLSP